MMTVPEIAKSYVLDSYAIIAYQFGEEGKDKLEEILLTARSGNYNLYLNLINLGEVITNVTNKTNYTNNYFFIIFVIFVLFV